MNSEFCTKLEELEDTVGEILDGLEDLVYSYADFAKKNKIISEDVLLLADRLREELDAIYNEEIQEALESCEEDDE